MCNYENPNSSNSFVLRTHLWLILVDTFISEELGKRALDIQNEDKASWKTRICDFNPILNLRIPSDQFTILKKN